MTITVKICGVTDAFTAHSVVDAGAHMIGLVFFAKSPRHLTLPKAVQVVGAISESVQSVGLFVDPTDAELEATLNGVKLGMLQLHGSETPERIAYIKSRFGKPVMKAFAIASAEDLECVASYEESCDWLLFDARPPAKAVVPGGNGIPFDWRLLSGRTWKRPWMLSGGLNSANVAEAIRISGAKAVDVSSGVETSPGAKNAGLVRDFIAATMGL
jgi:phosphoribosylanthranilate isomerase